MTEFPRPMFFSCCKITNSAIKQGLLKYNCEIVRMNGFENWFLSMGLSWQTSKLIPFILVVVAGVLIGVWLKRKVKKKWLRITIPIVTTLVFFLGYFLYSPIYEGDFS